MSITFYNQESNPICFYNIQNWQTSSKTISLGDVNYDLNLNNSYSNTRIFNSDWFLISQEEIGRVMYNKMNPEDFEYLRYGTNNMAVIHDNSFLVLSNGSVVMNPPPVFIPSPLSSVLIIFAILICLIFVRRIRNHCK